MLQFVDPSIQGKPMSVLELRRAIVFSVKSILSVSGASSYAYYAIQGWTNIHSGRPTLKDIPCLLVAYILVDVSAYVVHRALHRPWWYRHVHKAHHIWTLGGICPRFCMTTPHHNQNSCLQLWADTHCKYTIWRMELSRMFDVSVRVSWFARESLTLRKSPNAFVVSALHPAEFLSLTVPTLSILSALPLSIFSVILLLAWIFVCNAIDHSGGFETSWDLWNAPKNFVHLNNGMFWWQTQRFQVGVQKKIGCVSIDFSDCCSMTICM